MAKEKGIDIIGICDHNSAENVSAAINSAALTHAVTVIPGMGICTKEEVHIIGIFEELKDVLKMQELVYKALSKEKNNPQTFGEQIIANESDEVEGYNEQLLIGAFNLSIQKIVEQIHKLNGVAIASHIDREAYSLSGQLGFIPEDLKLDVLEISPNIKIENAIQRFSGIEKFPLIHSSDAHFLEDIGKATTKFLLAEPTINELKIALHKKNRREISYE